MTSQAEDKRKDDKTMMNINICEKTWTKLLWNAGLGAKKENWEREKIVIDVIIMDPITPDGTLRCSFRFLTQLSSTCD